MMLKMCNIFIFLNLITVLPSLGQPDKIFIPNNIVFTPIEFHVKSDIDTSILCETFYSVIDSLNKIYFTESSDERFSMYSNCCMKVTTTIEYSDQYIYQNHFKYSLVTKFTTIDSNDNIFKKTVIFKDLNQLIESKNILKSNFFNVYLDIFRIFGDKGVFEDDIQPSNFNFKLKRKFDLSTKYEVIVSDFLDFIINKKTKKSLYNFNNRTTDIDKILITPVIEKKDEGISINIILDSEKNINIFDEKGKEIETRFFIKNEYLIKSDYTLLYGKLSTFIYRLIGSNN